MKYLTDRLTYIQAYIRGHKVHESDKEQQGILDIWIELNAVAEVLPEITIAAPPTIEVVGTKIGDARP